MQTVAAGFTAEERDSTRSIAQNTRISWHKEYIESNQAFTIGVSTIGGNDVIGANPGAIGSPSNYRYFDESAYVTSLSWERGISMPLGGLSKAIAQIRLSNTSGRFTPRFMGGTSELYTAIQPRRPVTINAGFNYNGIDQVLPQFVGLITEQPRVDQRTKTIDIKANDYLEYFQNKYLDQAAMFTAQRTDQVMRTLLTNELGMSTAQFDLDYGINVIPFGMFPSGSRMSDIFNELAAAENGNFYQDENGIFKFENRQHWDSAPYTQVQRVILTSQVLQSKTPSEDHLINVVEVRSKQMAKQPEQTIFRLNTFDAILIPANGTKEIFIEFDSPALSMTTPTNGGAISNYLANSDESGNGTDLTGNVSVSKAYKFSNTAKLEFTNTSSENAYLTSLNISGRTAKAERDIYVRSKDGSSLTAYQEKSISITNQFIQDESWAQSLSQMILNDFSDIENIQELTIRAIPELQLGDLVSWQGRYWRIFDIKSTLDPASGYVQTITLLQRTITSYFRIGISTIGGSDKIAP